MFKASILCLRVSYSIRKNLKKINFFCNLKVIEESRRIRIHKSQVRTDPRIQNVPDPQHCNLVVTG
jgi:hypothetical protein